MGESSQRSSTSGAGSLGSGCIGALPSPGAALADPGHQLVQVLLTDPSNGEIGRREAPRPRRPAVLEEGPQGRDETVRQDLHGAAVVEVLAVGPGQPQAAARD